MARSPIYITVKRPGGARRTFALIKDQGKGQPKVTLKDSRLDAINQTFLKGQLDFATANSHVESLKAAILAEYEKTFVSHRPTVNDENLQIAEKYYHDEIADRPLKDPREPYNRLIRAVTLLGKLSLRTASQKELQKCVNILHGFPKRKAITSLQSLLKYIGRSDVQLFRGDSPEDEVKHLTEVEYRQLLKELPDRPLLRVMVKIAYGTGMRTGEIMGLRSTDLIVRNGIPAIHVQRQKIRPTMEKYNGNKPYRLPKGKQTRFVAILNPKETLEAFEEWTQASEEEREELRYICTASICETAMRLWPKVTRTHGGLHMLRATHCIALLVKGASVAIAAKQLGDSEEVVQKHYASFVHTDETLSVLQKLLKS